MPRELLDIQWRLDVPLASRRQGTALEDPPQYTVCLVTVDSDSDETNEEWITCDYETLVNMTKTLQESLKALRTTQYRRLNRLVK